tara:strand:+ start:2137 stop:2298 length:162 start_codon:yes stop_codon:yes gene_type:complete
MSAEYRAIRRGAAAKGERLNYALHRRKKKSDVLKFRRKVRAGAEAARQSVRNK